MQEETKLQFSNYIVCLSLIRANFRAKPEFVKMLVYDIRGGKNVTALGRLKIFKTADSRMWEILGHL